jgi:type VI secretion system protein ImpA
MAHDLLEALLAPITPDCPGGADLSLTPDLDEIRSARKGDDPALAQGDWVRELKPPQWSRVRDRCEQLLKDQSKDLQVACWFAEALVKLEGFPGLVLGLGLLEGLLDRHWDNCHPALEGASAEERAGRIEWLDLTLAEGARQIPITAAATGGYDLLRWEESRAVDNLGLRNPQAREEAVTEGKLPGDRFQKAVLASGGAFYQELEAQTRAALEACQALQGTVDRRFGPDGPSLEGLGAVLQTVQAFAAQTRQRLFPPPSGPVPPGQPPPAEAAMAAFPAGPIRTRGEGILMLRATAAFFRTTEPHSPVACLVERAAHWAEMPLESWLAEVIKDAPTLAQVRELLSFKQEPPTA